MTRRQEIITEMLRHYNDAEDPMNGPSGVRGDGLSLPLMPEAWNQSYRELERVLKVMRDEVPWLWWDIRERFLACQVRMVEAKVSKGRVKLPDNCEVAAGAVEVGSKTVKVRVRQWSPLVRQERVEAGVCWISERFRGEPFLPDEFAEQAA